MIVRHFYLGYQAAYDPYKQFYRVCFVSDQTAAIFIEIFISESFDRMRIKRKHKSECLCEYCGKQQWNDCIKIK